MNKAWLDKVKADITQIWRAQPEGAPFFSKLRQVTKFYKDYCKGKAASFREEELQAHA
jgi:hypothetical protein